MTRESRKLGFGLRFTLFLGVLLVLLGFCVNVAWLIYHVNTPGATTALYLYIINLLPGFLLLAIPVIVLKFSMRRSRQFLTVSMIVLGFLLSFLGAVAINVAGLFVVLTFGASEGPISANTPQEMFRYTIRDPIPPSISNLEGFGDTSWQGYSIFLRFRASESDINLLVSRYRQVKCSAIADRFTLPKKYNHFKPTWNPNLSGDNQCYEANRVANKWTHSGSHYFATDRESGTVHFHGIGA